LTGAPSSFKGVTMKRVYMHEFVLIPDIRKTIRQVIVLIESDSSDSSEAHKEMLNLGEEFFNQNMRVNHTVIEGYKSYVHESKE